MTIKQQGGIFGRNPTFNDVTVEGDITLDGTAIPDPGTILVDGDIGSTVQGYDADTAKYDDTTANFTGTLQEGGNNVVTANEVGTIASQDADSVNIDGGAIDGVTLGTNSAVTEAQVDNININGNSITSTDTNGNIVINPDGTGKVGVNQSSLKADLHLNGTQFIGNTTTGLEISDTSLYISRSVSPSLARSIEMTYTYNLGHVGAVFRRVDTSALSALPSSGSVTSDILSMDASTNNVIVSNGNLVIGTSGQGIDFSATSGTGTSELFSDYEEGTYTASLYGNTTGPGTPLPLSSSYNTLAYTKIGRQVTITGKLETSGSHSASGYLRLTVPFVGADLSDSAGTATGSVFFYRTGQLHTNPSVITGEGTSTVIFYENTAGGDVTTINAEDMDAAIEVFFGFTYFTT